MNQTVRPSLRVSLLAAVVALALVGFFFWLGLKLVKYNYPDSLNSAKGCAGLDGRWPLRHIH